MSEIQVYSRCLGMGMTPAGAAGATANIMHESGGRADNLEDTKNRLFGISDAQYIAEVDAGRRPFAGDSAGFGIAQWTVAPRKEKFLRFMKEHGWSIAYEPGQYQYLAKELREDYPAVWKVLTTTSDPYEAGYIMCKRFEIPANTEAESNARGAAARAIYQRCSGTAPVVDPSAPAASVPADPDQTAPVTTTWPPRTVDRSMHGADVAALQAILAARGYSVLSVSGVFDGSTEAAVRKYQKQHGLQVDGVVGPNTWAALLALRR